MFDDLFFIPLIMPLKWKMFRELRWVWMEKIWVPRWPCAQFTDKCGQICTSKSLAISTWVVDLLATTPFGDYFHILDIRVLGMVDMCGCYEWEHEFEVHCRMWDLFPNKQKATPIVQNKSMIFISFYWLIHKGTFDKTISDFVIPICFNVFPFRAFLSSFCLVCVFQTLWLRANAPSA